ncbi:hypothetical protein J4232_01255 [Candidatus Woesearchaeota archaeon]|nr:hypothetical protein [Candidatus Woesearchaeota archaeon]
MIKRKADLSINIVIITIIAIVVLVVITYIFTGRLALFNKNLSECKAVQGAECNSKTAGVELNVGCKESEGYIADPSRVCLKPGTKEVDDTLVCCIPLLK